MWEHKTRLIARIGHAVMQDSIESETKNNSVFDRRLVVRIDYYLRHQGELPSGEVAHEVRDSYGTLVYQHTFDADPWLSIPELADLVEREVHRVGNGLLNNVHRHQFSMHSWVGLIYDIA